MTDPDTTPLQRIRERLVRAGAAYPVTTEGTIESAIKTGLSIALVLVDEELERGAEQATGTVTLGYENGRWTAKEQR